jgi:polyphosphate glucokinase
MQVLGIDFGGTGIKGAIVDIKKGELISGRLRLPTPERSKPQDVGDVIKEIAASFKWKDRIGLGFPAIIKDNVAYNAANISKKWIGLDVKTLLHEKTGCEVYVVNDADAAGIAEISFGAGREFQDGIVLMLTLGTGIGSAIFVNGQLLPNTEFGHIQIRGKDAEHRASDVIRQKKQLSWKAWSKRFQEVLDHMEMLINPDVIIIGGGVSKYYEKYFGYLKTNAQLLPAHFFNQAGIIGAAIYASQQK